MVFAEDGTERALGPSVGSGFRWRHVIVCAGFTGSGLELVSVCTPHIGGVVEFYALEEGKMEIVA